jgi:F-type H+-transporting ATPase subunit b
MVDSIWLIYTITLIAYIGLLFVFFWRRHQKQEQTLNQFLEEAKKQLESYKHEAHNQASVKVTKAFELIKRLQKVAEDLEEQAQEEYNSIIEEAKAEKKAILDEARKKAEEITHSADSDLDQYRSEREREIEKSMIKLVMSVTEKVIERSLSYEDHVDLIQEALEEVKQQKERL